MPWSCCSGLSTGSWLGARRLTTVRPLTAPKPLSLCPTVALSEPLRLQEVDVRVVGLDSCRRLYYPEPITKNMLCAGDVQGQKGFCEVSPVQPASLSLMHRRLWESHWTSPTQFPQKWQQK